MVLFTFKYFLNLWTILCQNQQGEGTQKQLFRMRRMHHSAVYGSETTATYLS